MSIELNLNKVINDAITKAIELDLNEVINYVITMAIELNLNEESWTSWAARVDA